MSADDYSEAELKAMSDEEREALTGPESDEEVEGDNPEDAAGFPEESDDGEADAGPGAVMPDNDEAPVSNDSATQTPFVPQYEVLAQDDLKSQMTAIDGKIADLNKQLEDGDIDFAEYNRQKDTLTEEKYGLREHTLKNQMAEEHNRQSADQLWKWEQGQFFRAHPEYVGNHVLMGALQASIHHLDGKGGDGQSMAGMDVLSQADMMVKQSFGAQGQTPQGAQQQKQPQGGQPPKDPRNARSKVEIPQTLGGLPAADANATAQDEFAYLEKLLDKDPAAYERALAKLTPDQQDRYLRG